MKTVSLQSGFFALMGYFLIATSDFGIAQQDLCNGASIRELKNFVRVTKNQSSETQNTSKAETWTHKVKCHKDLSNRSICPWDCYENYDNTRYPQIIKEKICEERKQRGSPNSCRVMTTDEMHCANLTTNIQVLAFIQHCNHFDIYRNQTIQVYTGCSCINAG